MLKKWKSWQSELIKMQCDISLKKQVQHISTPDFHPTLEQVKFSISPPPTSTGAWSRSSSAYLHPRLPPKLGAGQVQHISTPDFHRSLKQVKFSISPSATSTEDEAVQFPLMRSSSKDESLRVNIHLLANIFSL